MLKIVFLCSGGGGNLRFIEGAIHLGWIKNAIISGVITDRECLATQFANERKIWTKTLNFSEDGQVNVLQELHRLSPDIIITNVHKILSPSVVDSFRGKLVNLHYSLLPSFGAVIGTKAIDLALAYGVKFLGTTAHLVDILVDTGKPLVQTIIPIEDGDTTESLTDITFRCGCLALLQSIQILRKNETSERSNERYSYLELSGRKVSINPPTENFSGIETESFWQQLKSYK